jgi:hypothetical protein
VVSVALYANTLGHAFVWDDFDLIVENRAVRTLDTTVIAKIFRQDLWTEARDAGRARLDTRYGIEQPYYRPLVALSYHVEYKLFEGKPAGFHAVNVLVNAVACTLAFAFLYVLFRSVALAMLSALLFAVHPTHTEAVAWIAGRTDVFATFWSLGSLFFYVLARRRHRTWLLLISLAAFMLGMLCKEISAAVPFLVVLLELGPFKALFAAPVKGDRRSSGGLDTGAALRIAAFFGVLVSYFVFKHAMIGNAFTANVPMVGEIDRVALPFAVLAAYVYKVLFPLSLSAAFSVPVPTTPVGVLPAAGMLLAAFIGWSAWRFRRRADVTLGIGIFVLGIAPVLQVVPIATLSAERFLFFPSLGAALILGSLFAGALAVRLPTFVQADAVQALRVPLPLAAALVPVMTVALVGFAARTVARNADWRDTDTLFGKTAEQARENPIVLRMLGGNAHRKGDIEGASWAYEKMLELAPDDAVPRWNLGLIRMQQGDSATARKHFVQAAKGGDDFRAAYYHIAVIDKAAGNMESARENARRFLSLYDKDDRYRREAEAIAGGE